jgi:hypothetical protein
MPAGAPVYPVCCGFGKNPMHVLGAVRKWKTSIVCGMLSPHGAKRAWLLRRLKRNNGKMVRGYVE